MLAQWHVSDDTTSPRGPPSFPLLEPLIGEAIEPDAIIGQWPERRMAPRSPSPRSPVPGFSIV